MLFSSKEPKSGHPDEPNPSSKPCNGTPRLQLHCVCDGVQPPADGEGEEEVGELWVCACSEHGGPGDDEAHGHVLQCVVTDARPTLEVEAGIRHTALYLCSQHGLLHTVLLLLLLRQGVEAVLRRRLSSRELTPPLHHLDAQLVQCKRSGAPQTGLHCVHVKLEGHI